MSKMVDVFPIEQVPSGAKKVVTVSGARVLLLNVNDELFAIQSSCPHMRFPLVMGRVTQDCGIICPFHHSAFDLRTGDVKAWSPWPPGIGRLAGQISREKALPIYKILVENGMIKVSSMPVPRSEQ